MSREKDKVTEKIREIVSEAYQAGVLNPFHETIVANAEYVRIVADELSVPLGINVYD